MARGSAGNIVITTGLDNSKLEQQLDDLQTKLENQELDLNITNIDYEYAKKDLEDINSKLQDNLEKEARINVEIEKQKALQQELNAKGEDSSEITSKLLSLYDELDPISQKTLDLYDAWFKQYDIVDKIEFKILKQNNAIEETRRKIERVVQQANSVDFSKLEKGIEKISKRITKIGLAIIGISSLSGMITSSISRIKEAEPELQAQTEAIQNIVDNIVYRLINLLLPVLETIVGLIRMLFEDLLGIDVSSYNFHKNVNSAAKSAAKLRKQLLGFDEMNILNKDGTIGGLGAGTGGVNVPVDYEFPKEKDLKQKATEAGVIMADSFLEGTGVSGGLAEIIFGRDSGITQTIKKIKKLQTIGMLGVGGNLLLTLFAGKNKNGTVKDIKNILNSTNSMAKEMANKIRDEFSSFSVDYENGIVEIHTKTGQVMKLTEQDYYELMDALGIKNYKTFDGMKKESKNFGASFTDTTQGAFNLAEKTLEDLGLSFGTTVDDMERKWLGAGFNIENEFNASDGVKGAITTAFNTIETNSSTNADKTKKNWLGAGFEIENKYTGSNGVSAGVINALDEIPGSTETNTRSALDVVTSMIKKFKPPSKTISILATLDTSKMMESLRKIANTKGLGLGSIIVALEKKGFAAKGAIINPPRLASGGIVNRPGRGVYVGGAIAGERGREAVVPLTDTQQMEYLGREIAKNIVVNLTNVTELDGRILARSVSQVMNDMNFASNGGVI